jgi:hypothetical protein
MQLQPHPNSHLHNRHQHQTIRECSVDMRFRELAAPVQVSKEVRGDGDGGAEELNGHVPAGVDEAQYHAGWVDEAEGEGHEEDVSPED